MEHLIKLGYVFVGAWALLSVVGIVGFYIVVRSCRKEREKSYKEYRKRHEEFEKEWTRYRDRRIKG